MVEWNILKDKLPIYDKYIMITFKDDRWIVTVTGINPSVNEKFINELLEKHTDEVPIYWAYLNMPEGG